MEVVDGGGEISPPPPPPQSGGENGKASNGEKPKRQMKSPYQLQVLEETYAVESYPSEALRAELAAKIGLSDRQLQMWFCHRRLKDRKFQQEKRGRKEVETSPLPPRAVGPARDVNMAGPSSSGSFSGSGEVRRAVGWVGTVTSRYSEPMPMLVPLPMPPLKLSLAVVRVIASVESQLGERVSEDGPILGEEFDP